jgi:hypothetical protein
MSEILKCSACNLVIDEMLSYIQNKLSVMDEETLVRLCTTSFTIQEIQKSKTLLLESLPAKKRSVQRKGGGKEHRDLSDIIQCLKTTDPDLIPVYVSRQLEKLPPVTFDHLDCTKLLKDLVRLQADLDNVKSTYVTHKDLDNLKSELSKINSVPPSRLAMGVNTKRGAWCLDSGPIGLSNTIDDENGIDTSSSPIQVNERKTDDQFRSIIVPGAGVQRTDDSPRPAPAPLKPVGVARCDEQLIAPVGECTSKVNSAESSVSDRVKICPSVSVEHPQQNSNENSDDKDYETVTYKRKKVNYRYRGQVGTASESNNTFKAAIRKIPMFITNVQKNALEKDITSYIKSKTQETVSLEKIYIKKDHDHKAYKFFICQDKLPLFLDEKLWPKGIIFRRFVHFHYRHNTIRGGSENGNTHNSPTMA